MRECRLCLPVVNIAIRFSVLKAGILLLLLFCSSHFGDGGLRVFKSLALFISDFFLHNLTHMHDSYDIKKRLPERSSWPFAFSDDIGYIRQRSAEGYPPDRIHILYHGIVYRKLKVLLIFVFVVEFLMVLYRFSKMLTRLTAFPPMKVTWCSRSFKITRILSVRLNRLCDMFDRFSGCYDCQTCLPFTI